MEKFTLSLIEPAVFIYLIIMKGIHEHEHLFQPKPQTTQNNNMCEIHRQVLLANRPDVPQNQNTLWRICI